MSAKSVRRRRKRWKRQKANKDAEKVLSILANMGPKPRLTREWPQHNWSLYNSDPFRDIRAWMQMYQQTWNTFAEPQVVMSDTLWDSLSKEREAYNLKCQQQEVEEVLKPYQWVDWKKQWLNSSS